MVTYIYYTKMSVIMSNKSTCSNEMMNRKSGWMVKSLQLHELSSL